MTAMRWISCIRASLPAGAARSGYHRAAMSAFFTFLSRLLFLAMGCGLVLRAGRLEAAGELEQSRRGARAGGFVAALGSLVAAAGAASLPAASGRERGIAAACFLASGAA